MSDRFMSARQPLGFVARILAAFGRPVRDKPTLCNTDRMAQLDDPATRKALAGLPPHLLRDIGIIGHVDAHTAVDGDALRRHLW